MWTHFRNNNDGTTTLFDLGKCETCGEPVQLPNAVGGVERDIPKYFKLGMKEWTEEIPPEIAYNEDTDKTDCDACHQYPASVNSVPVW
jgi:hypothetical protein